MSLKIYPPKTAVMIGGGIDAMVVRVCIAMEGHVTYECTWFEGRTRVLAWVEACEIECPSSKRMEIGFHSPEQQR